METQTRYDLVAAIENWRQELAAQSNLTDDARRELETHLRDTIAGFQQRGLGDEESFWLASRRMGPAQQLGEEFAKANPTAIWRERLRWITQGMLIVALWGGTANLIAAALSSLIMFGHSARFMAQVANSVHFALAFFVRDVPIFVAVYLLLRGNSQKFARLTTYFQPRSRFLFVTGVWLAVNTASSLGLMLLQGMHQDFSFNSVAYIGLASRTAWPLGLLILVAWLTGSERRFAPVDA